MTLYYKILAKNDEDLYSSYSGSIPLIQLFEGVPYEKVDIILAGGSELIKTVMDISFTPDIPLTNGLYAVEFLLSLNNDIPDYDLDYYNDIDNDSVDNDDVDDNDSYDDIDDSDDDDDGDGCSDITWIINYNYDSHWDCYCKTRPVCGCGCDPLHDGW